MAGSNRHIVSGGADKLVLLWDRERPTAPPTSLAAEADKVNAIVAWKHTVAVASMRSSIALIDVQP